MKFRQTPLIVVLAFVTLLPAIAGRTAQARVLHRQCPDVQGTRRIVLEQLKNLLGKSPQLQAHRAGFLAQDSGGTGKKERKHIAGIGLFIIGTMGFGILHVRGRSLVQIRQT